MGASRLDQYRTQVERQMKKLYGVTLKELGDDPDGWLQDYCERKVPPKEFALEYGEKYDLTLASEWMTN